MRIFSIKEITDATIKLLDSDTEVKSKNNNLKSQKKLTFKTKKKNLDKNKNIIQNTQKPLVVKNEILENPNYQAILPSNTNKITGKIELEYDVLKDFSITSRLGYNYVDIKGKSFSPLVYYGAGHNQTNSLARSI